jgi:uncharacterized protein
MFKPDEKLASMVQKLTLRWPIERIVLFGSRARGDHEALSDYDLLVIVRDDAYYKGLSTEMLVELKSVGAAKDVVLVKESRYSKLQQIAGTIYYEAMIDGVEVYAAA